MTMVMLFLMPHCTRAQGVITQSEWGSVIKLLEAENWRASEKLTLTLLKSIKPGGDTSYDAANLRYMYLVSVAGQLAHKDIDKAIALKKCKVITGKVIITPGRTIKHDGMFNYFKPDVDSGEISCCTANNIATEIQIFESYKMSNNKDVPEAAKLEGKTLRIKARVIKIEAEGFTMPRLKILFADGYFYSVEDGN